MIASYNHWDQLKGHSGSSFSNWKLRKLKIALHANSDYLGPWSTPLYSTAFDTTCC